MRATTGERGCSRPSRRRTGAMEAGEEDTREAEVIPADIREGVIREAEGAAVPAAIRTVIPTLRDSEI